MNILYLEINKASNLNDSYDVPFQNHPMNSELRLKTRYTDSKLYHERRINEYVLQMDKKSMYQEEKRWLKFDWKSLNGDQYNLQVELVSENI